MNPAFSVIFFTTASGAGFGALLVLGVLLWFMPPAVGNRAWLAACVFVLFSCSAGLASSALHLGKPLRAWRAFSQWRSSWLSREAVVAMACYVPLGGLAALLLLGGPIWLWRVTGAAAALLALATLFCTARIYDSLKPVPAWAQPWTLPSYLSLGLYTGTLWLAGLGVLKGALAHALVLALCGLAGWIKAQSYRHVRAAPAVATIASATGLNARGQVRAFEAPHTEANYLLHEMGFKLGRKHAVRLRRNFWILALFAPLVLFMAALLLPAWWQSLTLTAALLASLGTLCERWLFFAEAKHVVTLYYGAQAV